MMAGPSESSGVHFETARCASSGVARPNGRSKLIEINPKPFDRRSE
jgi:hypothetical protein